MCGVNRFARLIQSDRGGYTLDESGRAGRHNLPAQPISKINSYMTGLKQKQIIIIAIAAAARAAGALTHLSKR